MYWRQLASGEGAARCGTGSWSDMGVRLLQDGGELAFGELKPGAFVVAGIRIVEGRARSIR